MPAIATDGAHVRKILTADARVSHGGATCSASQGQSPPRIAARCRLTTSSGSFGRRSAHQHRWRVGRDTAATSIARRNSDTDVYMVPRRAARRSPASQEARERSSLDPDGRYLGSSRRDAEAPGFRSTARRRTQRRLTTTDRRVASRVARKLEAGAPRSEPTRTIRHFRRLDRRRRARDGLRNEDSKSRSRTHRLQFMRDAKATERRQAHIHVFDIATKRTSAKSDASRRSAVWAADGASSLQATAPTIGCERQQRNLRHEPRAGAKLAPDTSPERRAPVCSNDRSRCVSTGGD